MAFDLNPSAPSKNCVCPVLLSRLYEPLSVIVDMKKKMEKAGRLGCSSWGDGDQCLYPALKKDASSPLPPFSGILSGVALYGYIDPRIKIEASPSNANLRCENQIVRDLE